MTASTPPLVEVIAGVLAVHWTFSTDTDDYPRFVDRCDGCHEIVFNHGRENNQNQSYAAHQARAVLAAISEAGAVEWGVAIVAQGFNFDGCTQQNDTYCACATWEEQECSSCCEAIEDGQLIYSLTRRGNPALSDDDENQWHDHFFKHAECPEVSAE